MTETTALGAAVAAGAADGIALWDITKKEQTNDVTIFHPKLDESGETFSLFKDGVGRSGGVRKPR